MIDDKQRAELLLGEIRDSRAFIAGQLQWRYYLIGATFLFAFLLLLPLRVPPKLVEQIARHYNITEFAAPAELLSTLLWYCWLTALLQACQRSVVVAREAGYIRTLEERLQILAGETITRQSGFAAHPVHFLRLSEALYYLTFSMVALLVGGYRLREEWIAEGWSRFFACIDGLLLVGAFCLVLAAVRHLRR